MKKAKREIKNSERDFDVEELFFSTTDKKGIITACNEVFLRVGGYPADELIGRPHNIIRHPHMPRCVFKLLWDYLLRGKTIGAYVKNLAKSGEYYWVFALASPIDEGFLSIRLKPTSKVFSQIPALYAKILQEEEGYGNDWKEGMREGTEVLLGALNTLGFAGYDDFMSLALKEEMRSRDRLIKTSLGSSNNQDAIAKVRTTFATIDSLDSLKVNLIDKEQFLQKAVETLSLISINSSVTAARFGDEGRTLGVISSEISRISTAIRHEIVSFRQHLGTLCQALNDASLHASFARLQAEMSTVFVQESQTSKVSLEEQIQRFGKPFEQLVALLQGRADMLAAQTLESVASLNSSLYHFGAIVELMAVIVRTLRFAYVTGKTEASRLPDGAGFISLLNELNSFTDKTQEKLDELSGATQKAKGSLAAVL